MAGASTMSSNDVEHRLSSMLTTVAGMRELLLIQTRQIVACLHLLNEEECGSAPLPAGDPDINRVIKALMHMIGISAHSLVKLTYEVGLSAKDGYPLARAIIEGAVDIAYLMASDPEISRKAQRHAKVRAFRDLSRREDVGGWTPASRSTFKSVISLIAPPLTPGKTKSLPASVNAVALVSTAKAERLKGTMCAFARFI